MKTRLLYTILLFLTFTTLGFSQEVDLGDDITTCEGETIVLDATTQGATSYEWTLDGQVIQNWPNSMLVVTEAGLYEATAMLSGMTSSDDILITFNPTPDVNNPSDFVVESATGDFFTFDLTSNTAQIIGGNTNLQVTFHESLSDAENNSNPIVNPMSYTNVTNPQTIHVRAEDLGSNCFSVVNFNLEVETYTIVDCSQDPIITNYCYSNGDTTKFRFKSINGSPMKIEFLAGQVELNWDELIITDSDGITQLYNGYGNNGDVTGLLLESTGDEITVQVASDGSISCETNSYVPLQFSASCIDYNAFGVINVRSFLDDNNNGTYDVDELLFPYGNVLYEINNDGITNYGSANENYVILSDDNSNTYDLSFELYNEYMSCYNIITTTIDDVSVAIGEIITLDFPITAVQICEDVEVIFFNPSRPPRPGFMHDNTLLIKNNSTTTIASGTVEVVINNLLMFNGITSVNPNYIITNTATGFTVDFVNLEAFAEELIEIDLLCPASVALGEIVTNTATYTTATNDFILGNNNAMIVETVIGSWDPNDITESHGPEIIHENFTSEDYLYYTIRFQNLGTAEAVNVRIEEDLDTKLDETTFQMLASSHDFQVRRLMDELVWRFDDINLPAEMFDAEGSNGFVHFKIKPKPGYAIGDIIPGVAGIYFDFNAAVITNTFETEFIVPLSVDEVATINVRTYPNPATEILHIEFEKSETLNVQLLDVQGKQIMQKVEESNMIELNVSNVKSGIYFLKVTSASAQFTKKIIVN